ncbi:MAG: DNA double-strand break repair nuclease NurA [Candidatus Thorarchaeota archaeon]
MDQSLDRALADLVEEIERVETTRRGFGAAMSRMKEDIDLARFPSVSAGLPETSLIKKVKPTRLSGLKVAGVDGGLVRKRFRSMDLLFTRGIGVVFGFGFEEGPNVEYFPQPFPNPEVRPLTQKISTSELDQIASLERIASELRVAIGLIEEYHADLVLMDGSLVFHPRDRPNRKSMAYAKFQEVIALYRQLFHNVTKKRTILLGIIKDSRSIRIVRILGEILPHLLKDSTLFELMEGVDYRWLLKISRDCDILDTFLEEGERTFAFPFSTELANDTRGATDGLSSWISSIWITYLKTAKDDLPIRVEILLDEEGDLKKMEKALSAILPLSWQHPEYGVPTPILEADARAKISKSETDLIVDRLIALSGLTYSTLNKRRSRNPFGGS